MNNWNVILATIVIFGAGVVTGGLLVNHVAYSHPKNFRHPESALSQTNSLPKPLRMPEVLSKQFLQRLDQELHLAPEQRDAIQKIISEGQNQMRKTIQDARLEIREQLTPDQRKQFDDLVKRRRLPNATNLPATNSPGI